MSDRRAVHTAAGIYVALWLAGIAAVPSLPPCESQNAAVAQEPPAPAPEPTPAPEITASIIAPELAEPGTFVNVGLKTNGTKVNVRWLFDDKDDPAHFRPVNQRAAVVTALAGVHTISVFGAIDDTPILVVSRIQFGEPAPPEPPKPLSELVAPFAEALAKAYRDLAGIATNFIDAAQFQVTHDSVLKNDGITLTPAGSAAVRTRLADALNEPLDHAKLAATLRGVADELAKPPLPPGPTPGPAPIPVAGLHVLIVEETDDRNTLPAGQLAAIQSTLIPAEVKAKGGQFRQYDDDPPIADPLWAAARDRPRTSLPWIIVSNGTGGFEGPLPASIDETLALIRRFEQ